VHREGLADVRLGYFDGDGRCDALIERQGQWMIASAGGQEWQPLGAFGVPLAEVVFGRFDPNDRDTRPGVTKRTTHALHRRQDGQWLVTPLSHVDWQPVQSSSFPLSALRFGDFTGDGVTDVLAVDRGHWAISESARGSWRQLNPLSDPVQNLFVANLDPNDNVDDILRFDGHIARTKVNGAWHEHATLTWWRSRNGTDGWVRWKDYVFDYNPSPAVVSSGYAFAGRFGKTPGGGTVVIDPNRLGQFFSSTATGAGARREWTSQFAY
jgi:hypothetical protein